MSNKQTEHTLHSMSDVTSYHSNYDTTTELSTNFFLASNFKPLFTSTPCYPGL